MRIYLDNAATSWPKPESVYVAVDNALRNLGSPVGRGVYREGLEANRLADDTRDSLAKLIQAPSRRNIAFNFNCTDALNTAILGFIQTGDHVVTSVVEHNSVLRPLKHLTETKSVSVSYVGCDLDGKIDPDEVLAALRPDTRLVVLNHASNVTGIVQDLRSIGQACREKGIPFLVDAAQTIGYLPIDVRELCCDLLAAAGHKGLCGPLGTGFLYYTDEMARRIIPLRFGGTGMTRLSDALPIEFPEKFEAGNLNVPGLAGLAAALKFRQTDHWRELMGASRRRSENLLTGLAQLPGIHLHGPKTPEQRVSVFSIDVANFDSHELAAVLEGNWSIQTRAGFHCAPMLHQTLRTESRGGLVRISPGLFNTDEEIDILLKALEAIAR